MLLYGTGWIKVWLPVHYMFYFELLNTRITCVLKAVLCEWFRHVWYSLSLEDIYSRIYSAGRCFWYPTVMTGRFETKDQEETDPSQSFCCTNNHERQIVTICHLDDPSCKINASNYQLYYCRYNYFIVKSCIERFRIRYKILWQMVQC